MSEPFKTYALWGMGELTPENASALLEEYIPDNVGTVYRPERITRDQKGLRNALDWFESPDFLGPNGTLVSTDLIASLESDRDVHGDEVYLLALWPEVPGHEDFNFVESVQQHGITVLDLSRAMDELDLSLYSRPEPTKEEKAVARAEAAAAKKATAKRPVKKLSDVTPEQEPLPVTTVDESGHVQTRYESLDAVSRVIKDEIELWRRVEETKAAFDQALKEYMETVTVSMIPVREGVEAREERPPFEGPFVGEDTQPYYWSKSSDTYRPAIGKPKRGEIVVNLSLEEATEKMAAQS